jgi:hypothetical protein
MYRTFDDEVFLAPESIISGVLQSAAFDDELEPSGFEPAGNAWHAAVSGCGAGTDDPDAESDEPVLVHADADPIDAWARHARGANGFGG